MGNITEKLKDMAERDTKSRSLRMKGERGEATFDQIMIFSSLVSRSLTPKFKIHNVSQMNKQIRIHLDPTLSHQKTPHISMKTKGEKYHQLRF